MTKTRALLALLIGAILRCPSICAHPSEPPTISQGSVNWVQRDATLTLEVSEKTHIFWKEFSLIENENLEIIQPSTNSITILQVEGDAPSAVFGTLKSNGKIYLINPNGILIGSKGSIEASTLLLSTYPACACMLLEDKEEIVLQGESQAYIVNQGRLRASNKDVCIVSYQITNSGAIDAPLGTVALAASQGSIVRLFENEKVNLIASAAKTENDLTGIDNTGMVNACHVHFLSDGRAYSVAIRHAGLIDSVGLEDQPCEISFTSENGNQGIFGGIHAENVNGTGGVIQLFGENIAFFENSTVDASGEKGGGMILIGSDQKCISAKTVFIDTEVVIAADALKIGNGGNIIISTEDAMRFHGTLSACGGDEGGHGGNVEISGSEALEFNGVVDLTAPLGEIGNLLFPR